jgi:hypothetical protein
VAVGSVVRFGDASADDRAVYVVRDAWGRASASSTRWDAPGA